MNTYRIVFELNLPQMELKHDYNVAIRYRGFLLIRQPNETWLVRPERSPMLLLPFRTRNCSVIEVKKILERKLSEQKVFSEAA